MATEIANAIFKTIDRAVSTSSSTLRESLNKKVHVLDFSFRALRQGAPDLTTEEYKVLLTSVKGSYKVSNSLKRAVSTIKDPSTVFGYSVLVQDYKYGTYILSQSYTSLQKKLSSILKAIEHTSAFVGKDEEGKTVTNIGHISSNMLDATTSPLGEKLLKILKAVPMGQQNPVLVELNNLHNTHTFSTNYRFQRTNFDIKGFNKILGTATVLVTLQTATHNNSLAKIEAEIERRVTALVKSPVFKQSIITARGSNSIVDDIQQGVVASIKGKKFKSTHATKPVESRKTTVKGSGKLGGLASPLGQLSSRMVSVVNLQALIQARIAAQVRKNMGTGTSTNVLNYRTGRFADSVEVNRTTTSRAGMISVFYTYMKYPYATFSEGGKQELPRSRDPKLLISKSIREIGASIASNRMRAILS